MMEEATVKQEKITVFVLELPDECIYHLTLQEVLESVSSFFGDDPIATEGVEIAITVERVTSEFYYGLEESDFF